MLTTTYTDLDFPGVTEGVYAPQEDTQLLFDVMERPGERMDTGLATSAPAAVWWRSLLASRARRRSKRANQCRGCKRRRRNSPRIVGARRGIRAVRLDRLQSALR